MLFIQATFARLLFVFQQQDLVDDGNFVLNLNLGERVAHRFADVLRMRRCPAQNHAQTNDGGKLRVESLVRELAATTGISYAPGTRMILTVPPARRISAFAARNIAFT